MIAGEACDSGRANGFSARHCHVLFPVSLRVLTSAVRHRYYNDLWVYDIEEMSWRSVGRERGSGPSPRGGSQLAVHGDRFVAASFS